MYALSMRHGLRVYHFVCVCVCVYVCVIRTAYCDGDLQRVSSNFDRHTRSVPIALSSQAQNRFRKLLFFSDWFFGLSK